MSKQTQSTRIDKTLVEQVRKKRGRLSIQGFIEQAIEEKLKRNNENRTSSYLRG